MRRSSHQFQLTKLMPVLASAGADPDTKQAAVWIVTDNADYDDLGTLVSGSWSFSPGGRARAIGARETAQALQLCDQAGIDVTVKAIWDDRPKILADLEQIQAHFPQTADLLHWLRQKH